MLLQREPKRPEAHASCPFFRPVEAYCIHPIAGYCRAAPKGTLMIPSLAEHRAWCSTPCYADCPHYGARREEAGLESVVPPGRPLAPASRVGEAV